MAARETPRVKRARYVIGEGDRAQIDQLRQQYDDELATGEQIGMSTQHKRDLQTALEELDKDLWGDKPVLRAVPKEEAHEGGAPAPGVRRRLASATAIHARRGRAGADRYATRGARRARSTVGRRYQQTGIPATAESVAEFTMRTIGMIAGLSFLYLLLTPRGTRAIQLASSGGVHTLQALVSPNVDPLRSTASEIAAANSLAKLKPGTNVGQSVTNAGNQVLGAAARALGTGPHKPKPAAAHSVAGAFTG